MMYELRSLDQSKFTVNGFHFDSVKGQAWMKRVFEERLDEMEIEFSETWSSGRASHLHLCASQLVDAFGIIPAVSQTVRRSGDLEARWERHIDRGSLI